MTIIKTGNVASVCGYLECAYAKSNADTVDLLASAAIPGSVRGYWYADTASGTVAIKSGAIQITGTAAVHGAVWFNTTYICA